MFLASVVFAAGLAYSQVMHLPTLSLGIGGELYEVNDSGSDITVASAGTFYGWITATASAHAFHGGMTYTLNDATADYMTIPAYGCYMVTLTASLSGSNNTVIECAVFVDGVKHESTEFKRKLSSSGDVGSAAGVGMIMLNAAQKLSVRCTADGNGDVVSVERMNLTALRMSP